MEHIKKTSKNVNNKKDLIMLSLNKFFAVNDNLKQLLPIINGKSGPSLRIIDWFVTNYSKKNKTIYYLSREKKSDGPKYSVEPTEEYSDPFMVFHRYRSQLNGFQKKYFDPFCRNSRIKFYYNDDEFIITTVGQLKFFKWAIENNMLDYISDHLKDIEKDMNTNIRKLSPTTKKKSRKLNKGKKHKSPKPNLDLLENKTSDLNLEKNSEENQQLISKQPGMSQSKRRKRRELSVSASKTLNKYNFSVTLNFD